MYVVDLSRGHPRSRQAVCTSAAMYVSGIWRPDSHITLGSPFSAQSTYCAWRLRNQVIQAANIFSVWEVILRHIAGSSPLKRAVERSSRSLLIPISPVARYNTTLACGFRERGQQPHSSAYPQGTCRKFGLLRTERKLNSKSRCNLPARALLSWNKLSAILTTSLFHLSTSCSNTTCHALHLARDTILVSLEFRS